MNDTQATKAQEASARMGARRAGYSFNEYFLNKNDGEVWIQNLTDMQISLDIEIGNGLTEGKLIPPTPDPVNLTEQFAFEVLKKSARFRQAIAKRKNNRPQVILLDAAQVEGYYSSKARMIGAVYADGTPNIEAAMDAAEKTRRDLTTRQVDGETVNPSNAHNFAPPKTAQELIALDLASRGIVDNGQVLGMGRSQAGGGQAFGTRSADGGREALFMHEVVKPKVLHLCQQVSPQLPTQQRMPAEQFFAALQAMVNELTLDDYQHIEAHGTYKSVKKWARQQIAARASGEEGLPDNLSLAGQGQLAAAEQRGVLAAVPAYAPQGFGPQGPAAAAAVQPGMQYQGPSGFANAPIPAAYGAGESMSATILGPNGLPLDGA